ncbi:MAG: hypothetical protein GY765_17245, partial [bacterium]|nr:hypothetical protein [bacterium]
KIIPAFMPVPGNVNSVYLMVGKLDVVDGKYVVNGLQGALAVEENLKNFIKACHDKKMTVQLSIGGHGGGLPGYQDCWDLLTDANVDKFADALAAFCKTTGLDGIDFDWEPASDEATKARGNLVGDLIAKLKGKNSKLQTSLCTNASFWWHNQAEYVYGTAGTNLDVHNIMAYYKSEEVKPWLEDWIPWDEKKGIAKAQINVGMDCLSPALADNIKTFAGLAKSMGLSTNLWNWNPKKVDYSNKYTKIVWDIYNP